MSFHILHVFQHGATLAKEQGFIVCRAHGRRLRFAHGKFSTYARGGVIKSGTAESYNYHDCTFLSM